VEHKDNNNEQLAKVNTLTGEAIIHLLALTTGEYGRVDTTIGTKTAVGLALTIERIIKDHGFAKSIVRGEV
jgi:hypothetical protein